MESEGEETLVADVVDKERTGAISWRLMLGRNRRIKGLLCCQVGRGKCRGGVADG